MQTTVITEKQARQITGGRKPLVPIEYEEACKALDACESIDDAKYWADKSDALAAWAKIYHDDIASLKARRLKLKAYHRMGTLARELRPGGRKPGRPCVTLPGAQSLLREHGMPKGAASKAVNISRAPKEQLEKHIEAGSGVARAAMEFRGLGRRTKFSSDAWLWLTHPTMGGGKLSGVLSGLKQRSPRQVAAELARSEVDAARKLVSGLLEWLDEFEQYLPKSTEG